MKKGISIGLCYPKDRVEYLLSDKSTHKLTIYVTGIVSVPHNTVWCAVNGEVKINLTGF